jgi:uncharacterized protein YicC (UPF0701 family)
LGRGTIDCVISLKETGNIKPVTINTGLAKAYYKSLAELSSELNLDPSHILSTLVKMPEVIIPASETLEDKEWTQFQQILLSAIGSINQHRVDEGLLFGRRSLAADRKYPFATARRSCCWNLSGKRKYGKV